MEFNILPLAEAETFYITFFNLFQTESEKEQKCGYVCVWYHLIWYVSHQLVCAFFLGNFTITNYIRREKSNIHKHFGQIYRLKN